MLGVQPAGPDHGIRVDGQQLLTVRERYTKGKKGGGTQRGEWRDSVLMKS